MPQCVRYLHDPGSGLELILCRRSRICYPLHSHVSVFAAGLVLGGRLRLTVEGSGRVLQKGEWFLIPPDTPHSLAPEGCYSLLSLCLPAGPLRRQTCGDAKASDPIAALKRRLEQHPEEPLRLEEMAAAAYTSKYHLIRVFQRRAGLTPHQFQLQNRVRKAQRLLAGLESGGRAAPVTVAEAAQAAGFCDQSHLTRQFERVVGLSPAAYRAACGRLP